MQLTHNEEKNTKDALTGDTIFREKKKDNVLQKQLEIFYLTANIVCHLNLFFLLDGINHCYLLDASDDNDGASPSFLSICCFGGICNNDCDLVDFSFAWVLCVSERCVCC